MRVKLTGINKVRKRLANGAIVELHYAWRGRGAPCFWRSDSGIKAGSAQYISALSDAALKRESAKAKFREVVLAFLDSQDFNSLAARTQSDMKQSIFHADGIDKVFGDAPARAFDDPRIRKMALDWRDRIGGKVGDNRIRHLQRIVGFGLDRAMILQNHLRGIKAVYKSNRAEVVWTEAEIAKFENEAPAHVSRILVAATETGLRPGDLARLTKSQIEATPSGQRILVKTRKRGRIASIPVTPKMARIIAGAASDHIITNRRGLPYQHENYLGDAVASWRDKIGLRSELRLYDARGTAATRLLEAGAELQEIATAMGWSLKHAAEVIERYVALMPSMSDGLEDKLKRMRESS